MTLTRSHSIGCASCTCTTSGTALPSRSHWLNASSGCHRSGQRHPIGDGRSRLERHPRFHATTCLSAQKVVCANPRGTLNSLPYEHLFIQSGCTHSLSLSSS